MESIREIYKIGQGSSSSLFKESAKAAKRFPESNPEAANYRVYLYGSLAATGKGHLTDAAISENFRNKPIDLFWQFRLKKYNSPYFTHSFGLNISIHRHYIRIGLD